TVLWSLAPLFKSQPEVVKRSAVDVETFSIGSVHRNKLRRKVQNLAELCLAVPQRLREFLVLGHIDPCPDEPLEHAAAHRGRADPSYMTNRSVGTHNAFREVEAAMLRKHRLNRLRDE